MPRQPNVVSPWDADSMSELPTVLAPLDTRSLLEILDKSDFVRCIERHQTRCAWNVSNAARRSPRSMTRVTPIKRSAALASSIDKIALLV